ncbi:GTP 3',8-cyclase MoaA [Leptospira terpstrae]|uniref:Molybdenum cofactor biosynthesis protein A n=1 Tax=Leptospira terpstrae serovar Hualin str. LT 11-33 = ATCC 700639 TaxID=1257025 RepID=N1VUM1_9LEPT|nr:radical SAM protein [Leptospira terpstrae]EMY60705.1 molybdenum cofactor biosynthesis protein A [Leptospira terpstrae serovar Hualin str. LT 11-33 = ATCC 700639]
MKENTRKFEVLRVSILSHCSFACVYCAPKNKPDQTNFFPKIHFLSPELLETKIKTLTSHIHLKEVHLTGGEPTLHKNLVELIQKLKELNIKEVAITSNGFFQDGLIQKMKQAGLTRMNFSLDSFSQSGFERLSDRKLPVTILLKRILEAKTSGLEVKVNCTILKGYNESEILDLLQWSGENGIPIRFLEFMKMGPLQEEHSDCFYSAEEIRNTILSRYNFQRYPTATDSTATYHITDEGYIFGLIANHTEPFCEGCNRLRMDSLGRIYGCLSDQTSFDLPSDPSKVPLVLQQAMETKKMQFTGSELSMKFIGG